MIGAVVGNGPSKHRFETRGHGAYDYVLGCNIPGIHVDATIILDEEIAHIIGINPSLIECPIIISKKARIVLEKYTSSYSKFDIIEEFNHDADSWLNAGHYAAMYLIGLGCTKIDIWGCDSIFDNSIASSTDKLVKKEDTTDARFYKNWRKLWDGIFKNNSTVKFEIKQFNRG